LIASRFLAGGACAAILAGCGEPPLQAPVPEPTRSPIDVTMSDYKFTPNPLYVTAGHIIFRVTNVGRVGHDFIVLTPDGNRRIVHTAVVQPGAMVRVSQELAAGRYPVICTQPGHQELGMEATVIVNPRGNGG
jgi:uncharacterized cupredoxin-like copper-binding protein